jgi:hypothetical protein
MLGPVITILSLLSVTLLLTPLLVELLIKQITPAPGVLRRRLRASWTSVSVSTSHGLVTLPEGLLFRGATRPVMMLIKRRKSALHLRRKKVRSTTPFYRTVLSRHVFTAKTRQLLGLPGFTLIFPQPVSDSEKETWSWIPWQMRLRRHCASLAEAKRMRRHEMRRERFREARRERGMHAKSLEYKWGQFWKDPKQAALDYIDANRLWTRDTHPHERQGMAS